MSRQAIRGLLVFGLALLLGLCLLGLLLVGIDDHSGLQELALSRVYSAVNELEKERMVKKKNRNDWKED